MSKPFPRPHVAESDFQFPRHAERAETKLLVCTGRDCQGLVETLQACGAEVAWSGCNPLSTQDDIAGVERLAGPVLHHALLRSGGRRGGYGDQCSPISDTTVLSSLATGADLMDHVNAQLPLAPVAGGLAIVLYTLLVVLLV